MRYVLAVGANPAERHPEILVSWSLGLFAIYLLIAYAVFHLSGIPSGRGSAWRWPRSS